MKTLEDSMCKSCRSGRLAKDEVTQNFEREGLEVKIEGIPALVCVKCGQVYFAAGISDKISDAANNLFKLAEIKHAGMFKAAI